MTTRSGLLLVDKPKALTSHDVVARVRRVVGERRVGHAGTLDPMATGLLVLAVGTSTRLLRFAQSDSKRYCGAVTFGVRTDSLDADGSVLERLEVAPLDADLVNASVTSMLGPQWQIPPMVSAIKVKGKRLYELARQGVVVEREPRAVIIHEFSLTATSRHDVWEFAVTCSAGTYVRVLLSDLAQCLGTIGHLSALRRVSSGPYDVSDALTLDQVSDRAARGALVLQPPSALVAQLESVVIDDDQERRVRRGQRVELESAQGNVVAAATRCGTLVGVLERRGESWQPTVVLAHEDVDESE